MGTKYSLAVQNKATRGGSICVYTTSPDTQEVQNNLISLAWFAEPVNPGTDAYFDWTLDYSFAWDQVGKLAPGVNFRVRGYQDADPGDPNKSKIYFEKTNYGYQFSPDRTKAKPARNGALAITCSGSVADHDAAIGVGIMGKAALAVNAGPNLLFTFLPHIKYWVAFGEFVEGDVLDLNMMTQIYEVVFPMNVYSRSIILNGDNTWSSGDQY